MSNLYHPLRTVSVENSLLDFVEPAYIIRKGGMTKSFNINQTQTYSNSAITTKLEISNTQMVIDRNILWEQPISVTVTGSSVNGGCLLRDGGFALRSHALSKVVNTLNVQYGTQSYAFNSSDVISALERYNSYDCTKYNTDIAESYLDQSQSYDDFYGSNRHPLNLFSSGIGTQSHRGASELNVVSNPVLGAGVSGSASFTMTLRSMLITSPLLDQILKHGTGYGLTHINNLNIDLTLVPQLGARMFSFMRNINGDVLSISNISVDLIQPLFRFIQISPQNVAIPPIITYNLNTLERYPTDFTFLNQEQLVPSQVVQISRIPNYLMFFARPNNNVLQQGNGTLHGSQIPDAFASLVNAQMTIDGESLMANADVSMYYKMCSENQLVDSFVQYAGAPLVKSFGAGGVASYVLPIGSVTKVMFNKDILLKKGYLAPGTNYRTTIQVNATFKNRTFGTPQNVTNFYTLYLVCVYDDILQIYGDNLAQIGQAPISQNDVYETQKQNNNIHYDVLRNHNLTGAGILSGLSNLLEHGKKLYPMIHGAYSSGLGRMVRDKVKSYLRESGNSNIADSLDSIGFGAPSGGRMASRHRLGKNLL